MLKGYLFSTGSLLSILFPSSNDGGRSIQEVLQPTILPAFILYEPLFDFMRLLSKSGSFIFIKGEQILKSIL